MTTPSPSPILYHTHIRLSEAQLLRLSASSLWDGDPAFLLAIRGGLDRCAAQRRLDAEGWGASGARSVEKTAEELGL